MKNFSLDEMIEMVFHYAVEQKRATDSEKGKENISNWVKARLWENYVKSPPGTPFKWNDETPFLLEHPDWMAIRARFFTECVENNNGIRKISYAPHDLFEWFKSKLASKMPLQAAREAGPKNV